MVSLLTGILVAAGALAHLRSTQADEPDYFAIEHARVVTVSGATLDDATVLVEKGVIAAVGTSVEVPPEAMVIDGKGMTVYPGFIDAGTDIGLQAPAPPGAPPQMAGGGGGRRAAVPAQIAMGPEDRPGTTPWNDAADDLNTNDKRIETWRDAGFTTVLSTPKGGIFPGQGAVIDLAGERPGKMVVKAPATLEVSLQPVGGFWSFPGSLMGTVAYARQVFIDTRWYKDAEKAYAAHPQGQERPMYDRTERVVGRALATGELVLVSANSDIQIRRALRLVDEWKLENAALYGVQQSYDVANEIAAKKIPVLVNLKWPEPPKDADPADVPSLKELRFRDRAPGTPAALVKAGVKFGFYSGGLDSTEGIRKNLKKAVDAGLSPEAALRALTIDPATILGVSDRLGSIERGKIANLVVADGDIFGEKTKVKIVFVDGKRFEVHEAPPGEKHEGGPPGKPGMLAPQGAGQGGSR